MKKITLFLILLAGCSSLTHQKDEAAVHAIKKVALVAFMTEQPALASVGLNLSKGQLEANSTANFMAQSGSHADRMYEDMVENLRKNMNWSVVDKKTMVTNEGYTKAYKQTMIGWQNKMPPGKGMNQYLVEKVMDAEGPRILDQKGRDDLIEALKVDAIIVATVNVHLSGTSIMGIGNLYPQSNVSFFVYSKGVPKPVWFEGQISGEESKTSVGKTAFFDEKLLTELGVESARTAFKKIGLQ